MQVWSPSDALLSRLASVGQLPLQAADPPDLQTKEINKGTLAGKCINVQHCVGTDVVSSLGRGREGCSEAQGFRQNGDGNLLSRRPALIGKLAYRLSVRYFETSRQSHSHWKTAQPTLQRQRKIQVSIHGRSPPGSELSGSIVSLNPRENPKEQGHFWSQHFPKVHHATRAG